MSFSKLLLIIPPQHFVMEGFRTALVALAAYVHRNIPEAEIKLLDLSTTPQSSVRAKLEDAIGRTERGRILAGLSGVTADYQSGLTVARELKSVDQDILVVFGGHHASADAKVVLRNNRRYVDYVICGEGEVSLAQLMKAFPVVDQVPGLAFMQGDYFVQNPVALPLQQAELDKVPVTFEGWELTGAAGKFDHVTYVSARGCPLSCSFCAVSDQAIRAKSVTQVMRDVRELVTMGYSKIAFEDNFFAHSPRRTREVCGALAELQAEGLAFTWDCQTRVESLDNKDTIGLMERAGCEAVYIGVEALEAESLLFLGKTHDPRRYLDRLNQRVVPKLLDSNVACYINLQFGLPAENDARIRDTIRAVQSLGDLADRRVRKITIFPQLFVVYPGTKHFRDYVGLRDFPRDVFESFTEWEAEQKPILTWLGATFAHGAGGLPLGLLDRHALSKGRYTVDESAMARVAETIERVDGLAGVEVFRYGKHLVKENTDAA